ncbi:15246_t:CDS:1, partial [Gigaspora rosea]
MPCYASTIVRIKYVKKYEKEDANYIRVWAIGGYQIEREDNNFEMTLFVPINIDKRDPETQAIFEKDNFYCVGGKIVPSYYKEKKQTK